MKTHYFAWTYFHFAISLTLTLVLGLGQQAAALPEQLQEGSYRYVETTGTSQHEFVWSIDSLDGYIEITVDSDERRMINRVRENGETIFWQVRENGGPSVTATRNGDMLVLTGMPGQGQTAVRYEIDQRPWFQPLTFSLRDFLFSEQNQISFWCVRQDTLDIVSLQAKKKGVERLNINNSAIDAFKIEIRMSGLLAPFWHGTYWYSRKNGMFLQYRGTNGPPGTAETIIQLAGLPEQQIDS